MQARLRLQEWIHRMELGAGAKYVRWSAVFLFFATLALIYDTRCFRNFTNIEAMDAAQLGRNVARGRGFTTQCVRPLSIGLTVKSRADQSPLLKEGHRDISNPPVYPLVLAGMQLVTPEPKDLLTVKRFSIYGPNLYIAILNQALLGLGAWLVFLLARRWFNAAVAWMSVLLFVLTELYWRFTVSGLSTILLMDLVLLLVWLLTSFEQRVRENSSGLVMNALAIGAVLGVAMLTRYSAGWLILPAVIFVIACGAGRRWISTAAVLGAVGVIAAPWLVRNVMCSGLPFGTATYAIFEGTDMFAGDSMARSLTPNFTGLPGQSWINFVTVLRKGVNGLREIIGSDLPRLGGNWLSAFFLAGLAVRFQSASLARIRWFVVGTLGLFAVVQAFGRTHLAAESPDINSENLLVLFSPFAVVFGVGFFFTLFESRQIESLALRLMALSGFVALVTLPLALALMPPRGAVNAPLYYPPRIQQIARYLEPRELWMSDVPWAMAWYGDRQCVWLTRNSGTDFFAVNDLQTSVNGLFVSTRTGDGKFVSNWFLGEDRGWVAFLLLTFIGREVPTGFPLRDSPEGLTTVGELLLTDRPRWLNREITGEKEKKD